MKMVPSPSPTAQPGGAITGRYTLSITPSASCAMSRTPITFLMTGADAGVTTHPGVQVLLDPNTLSKDGTVALSGLAVSPDGHYQGPKGVESSLTFVAEEPDGKTRELSPAAFAKRYGWQNQPERVRLTEEARGQLRESPAVEEK